MDNTSTVNQQVSDRDTLLNVGTDQFVYAGTGLFPAAGA